MKELKIILILLIVTWPTSSFGQGFDRTYQGWWARTSWTFEFKSDGNYKRVSSGHYGNTTVTGTYELLGDTVQFISGHENTSGTVNEFYLIEGDSIIIDLNLKYDYKVVSPNNSNFYNSQIRKVKYPQIGTKNKDLMSDLEKVINIVFNSKEMKEYYHFDKLKNRQLLVADYGFLKVSIKVDELDAIFKPRAEIQDEFFIEFEDINLNPERIDLRLKINDEGVDIWFTFYKEDGKWKYTEPSIFEK